MGPVLAAAPRSGKRRAAEGADLTPVEGEDAHAHVIDDPKQLVDGDIVGSYPAGPGEARQSGEETGGQEVYANNQSGRKEKTSSPRRIILTVDDWEDT